MRASLFSLFASVIIAASPCDGFLDFINQANPALAQFAKAQDNSLLKIQLDVGQVDTAQNGKMGYPVITGNRLGIDGMIVELHGNQKANYVHPNLPGANGPNPQLSTGAMTLDLITKGKFIDLTGTRYANFEHGAWEIIWRKNAKAGSLICGFDVPNAISKSNQKDGAAIPRGRLYVTFPVWTEESLQDLRERKLLAEEKAVEAMERLKDETRKMSETSNLLMKALHFRSACKAHEDIEYSGYTAYKAMPLEHDMVSLKNGLNLCSIGTVWTKTGKLFGNDHVLLGSASAMAADREELVEKKIITNREPKLVAYDGLRP